MSGIYFGLLNQTKRERVSCFWENEIFCDLYSVMHRYLWHNTDIIMSATHHECHKFNGEDFEEHNIDHLTFTNFILNDNIDVGNVLYLGYSKIEYFNHIPEWSGNICNICKYKYDKDNKNTDRKHFDPMFYMN